MRRVSHSIEEQKVAIPEDSPTVTKPQVMLRQSPTILPSEPNITTEARGFCARHQLSAALQTALEIATATFDNRSAPTVVLEQDPETAEEFLVVELRTRGDVANNVAAHMKYASDWAAAASSPVVNLIRLVYEIS
jgi:hypothetical protein